MTVPEALIRSNPLLPAEDYNNLRKKGFKFVESFGSDHWTEYNNSDPGITILEALCYAITDLAYRTGFEMKDLLAPEELSADTWKNIFYTARQILHNAPLTINDYRKMIIDIEGVRNAWISPSKDYEVPLWINYNYYEEHEDEDCNHIHYGPKICYGKLQLSPGNTQQSDEAKEKMIKELRQKMERIDQHLLEIEKEIKHLRSLLDNSANLPDAEKAAIESKIVKFQEQQNARKKEKELIVQEIEKLKNQGEIPSKIVEFEGLYNVMIEYEEDVIDNERRNEIRQIVQDRLYENRNLGEDYLTINAVEYEDFGITASIALEEDADPDIVLANIYFAIYKYFTPSIPFYTIDQMLEKGLQIDEIFNGPTLAHGFIDTDELEATSLYRDIRLSDIINEVADLPGVKAITFLNLPFYGFDVDFGDLYFKKWVTKLRNLQKVARIRPELSTVLFCKDREFISFNAGTSTDVRQDRMLKLFCDLKKLERKYKLKNIPLDLPIPTGENMELEDYYPIIETLPMCFGISTRAGLPADATDDRKNQALQLKGYLLFFEQLLADYLVQLNHVKELFTFDDSVKRTYFTKPFIQLESLQDLIIDHNDHGANQWNKILEDFTKVLENIVETPIQFATRRNVFLNHMLARFAEDLTEYEHISRWLTPNQVDQRLIRDKINILANGEYKKISSDRGLGYNYASPDFWETDNISGTERRVSRLLGFRNVKRRSLYPSAIFIDPVMVKDGNKTTEIQKENKKGEKLNIIRIIDPESEETLFTSIEVIEGCCTEELLNVILTYIDQRKYFHFSEELKKRTRKSAGNVGTFKFELWDHTDPDIAIELGHSETYTHEKERTKAFKRLQKVIYHLNNNEGFHLVEHILLRPKLDEVLDEIDEVTEVKLLNVCLDACDLGIGLGEGTETPKYRKRVHRIPAARCFDKMPWVLEYYRWNKVTNEYDYSILFQEVKSGNEEKKPMKFRKYEHMTERIFDLREYGSERINYQIFSGNDEDNNVKFSFIIMGEDGEVLAQSPFIFNKKNHPDDPEIENDIEDEIACLMREFGYELDLFCQENSCDNNEDPYSFRATAVFPCWPLRFRNKTFRGLVEKTFQKESPAHMHINVVWVGINEMYRFEAAYCKWLEEMSMTEIPPYEAVNPLVEVINTLKSCGKCEDECSGD